MPDDSIWMRVAARRIALHLTPDDGRDVPIHVWVAGFIKSAYEERGSLSQKDIAELDNKLGEKYPNVMAHN